MKKPWKNFRFQSFHCFRFLPQKYGKSACRARKPQNMEKKMADSLLKKAVPPSPNHLGMPPFNIILAGVEFFANQATVRPCSRSVWLICCPMWNMRPPPFAPGLPTGCFHGFLRNRYIRKRRGNLTFARSEFQGLRIAHLSRTDNAESPRRYVYNTPFFRGRKKRHVDIHTTRTPLVAICSSDRSKVAKF